MKQKFQQSIELAKDADSTDLRGYGGSLCKSVLSEIGLRLIKFLIQGLRCLLLF